MNYDKLIARARGRKFLHIGLMLFWTVLGLVTSPWLFILTAFHWALASAYEQLDPVRAKRIRADNLRHAKDVIAVYESQRVIEHLKAEELIKRSPWSAIAVATGASFLLWGVRGLWGAHGLTKKLDLKGYTEGHARGADLSKGIFGPR